MRTDRTIKALRALPDTLDGPASTRALRSAVKGIGPMPGVHATGGLADVLAAAKGIGPVSSVVGMGGLADSLAAVTAAKGIGPVSSVVGKGGLADSLAAVTAAKGIARTDFKRTLGLASGQDFKRTLSVFTEPSSMTKMLRAIEGPALGKYPADTADRLSKFTTLSDRMLGAGDEMARKADNWERRPMLSAGPNLEEMGRAITEQRRAREAKHEQEAAEGRAMLQRLVATAEESQAAQLRAEALARAAEEREIVAEAKRAEEREAERVRAEEAEARRIEERDAAEARRIRERADDRRRSIRIALAGAAMTIASTGSAVALHFVG